MKFVEEFRDPQSAQGLIGEIQRLVRPDRQYRFMEFCGGHTHAIARHGLKALLPPNVVLIHGPGCPVCILPSGRIEMALDLCRHRPEVRLHVYGDCLRVPGTRGQTLESARAEGARVELVHSPREVLERARQDPRSQHVFLAIGFETTAPATAYLAQSILEEGFEHISLIVNHVLTPPAISALLVDPRTQIDGIIGPAHVSVVIGYRAYLTVAEAYQCPIVVTGFEPLDLLDSLVRLVRQVNQEKAQLENQFSRAVSADGNLRAQAIMAKFFEIRPEFEWRGLGMIRDSALRLRDEYPQLDAEQRFSLVERPAEDHRACECAAVLRGQIQPEACRVFGTACTPETPLGACMVSSEGACAAHYRYGRTRIPR